LIFDFEILIFAKKYLGNGEESSSSFRFTYV